jgi:hypothetical protein
MDPRRHFPRAGSGGGVGDETTVAQSGFTMTTNGQLVVLPRSGYGVMSVVAELPKTNHPGTSLKP